MNKSDQVKSAITQLEQRVLNLSNTQKRLDTYDGLNDGAFKEDNRKRLAVAKVKLSEFIEDNIEYVL